MLPVLSLALAILSQFSDSGWRETASPCVDSLLSDSWDADAGGTGSGQGILGEFDAVEDCDPEVASLFAGDRARETPRHREAARASFSASRSPGDGLRTVTRHAAARGGWDDRLELRDDAPTRWRLGYSGDGWRVVAGEMTDTALPAWPPGLPRRALPAGWRAATGTEESPLLLSAPVPQGIAAGALHERWKAWALRAWNPMETGEEPPWQEAWSLRHAAAGVSVSLPWTVSLQLADTRIARGGVDTLSERLLALGLASPAQGILGVDLAAALSESDAAGSRAARGKGWFLAAGLNRDFDGGAEAAFTWRQRGEGWISAWDPAIPEEEVYGAADPDAGDPGDGDRAGRGAGEIRASGRIPFRDEKSGRAARESKRESGYARGEVWSAWNPRAGSGAAYRRGARVALGRRAGDARLEFSGTHRVSRAASGSLSLYRLAQAEARIESFPRWRAAAWRAWNGEGALRAGISVGAEPEWGALRIAPGYRLEETSDGLQGRATLEARLRMRGLSLEVSAALPCGPAPDAGAASWRMTLSTGRM